MNLKMHLQRIQTFIPHNWLEHLQYLHSRLLFQWIIKNGSQPLKFSQKSAMVFSPHQDDETFGCGGTIAWKREHNIPVIITFITNGQGSSNSEDGQNQIVQIRKQEAVNALEILGVKPSEIYFLEKPDGKLPDLDNEERQQTIKQIAELLNRYQPEEVYVPHRKDCHRDHEATYQLVKDAIAQAEITVELLQYPIWLFWRAPLFILLKLQDIAAAYYVSISSVQDKKNRAISAYYSQISSLPPGFIQRFLGSHEIFFKS
ncbi:PIG-L family deacetylase [Tolypothrix sp. FACHB-123]|uniref:PIG-L deacetylase family protein n=1 Tax=Tolypothrix sp. FACHB-123 TaxID=2692868 RepID=UPI0016889AF1|nr:PIG-L family deacetylase [Tolypothrix sp. FACHB-123]MBD2354834.1 PIG-L family deacetylase [Tolypothrix sp. FACHB-123]